MRPPDTCQSPGRLAREWLRGTFVGPVPPSKSIQPTTASATANSLSSPYFARFASNRVPENRGVGGSIPPLTTARNGLTDPPARPFSDLSHRISTARRDKFMTNPSTQA